jgi:oxygen-dependent protoporphyrinogen oxidase
LPKLHRLEDEYGSFIRGAIKRRKALASEKAQGISKDVFSVKGGFGQLVKALQKKIGDEFIQLSAGSIKLEPSSDGSWVVTLGSTEKKITSKKVITTVPAYALPDLLSFIDTKEIAPISSLTYAPVVQIGVGLNNNSRVPLAFGGLIPSIEKEKILGILFNSSCYDDRAPKGKASLSFFLGGMKHPHLLNLSDEEIIKLVKTGLHRMMKYPEDTPIEKIYIFRHSKAIPQYEVDTEKRLEKINLLQEKYKGLILAGGIRDGIGLADRIKQATDLASL